MEVRSFSGAQPASNRKLFNIVDIADCQYRITMQEAHSTAVNSYNLNHANYDAYRPSFDPLIVDPFLEQLGLVADGKYDTGKKILEIAVGTGKFTHNLISHGWGLGSLKVMDPLEGMLASFKQNFPQIPEDDVILGNSYQIPLPDNSVDAVVIAQAFHWFAEQSSLDEIYRVLTPNGKLGCIWNFEYANPSFDIKSADAKYIDGGAANFAEVTKQPTGYKVFEQYFAPAQWSKKCCELIYSKEGGVPQYRKGEWRNVFRSTTSFSRSGPELLLLSVNVQSDTDVVNYWLTRLFITKLPEHEQKIIVAKIKQIIDEDAKHLDKSKLVKPVGAHAVVYRKE